MSAQYKNIAGSFLGRPARFVLVALLAAGAGACPGIDDIHDAPHPGMQGGGSGSGETGETGETGDGTDGPDLPCDTCHYDTDGTIPGTDTGGSGGSGGDVPTVVCGDGVVDAGEACDDGVNDGAYGGCLSGCAGLAPFCGDALVNDPSEACDDGNMIDDDGCTHTCESTCGDGVLQGPEACDGEQAQEGSCVSLGFVGGELGCDAKTCTFDTSLCLACGNGTVDAEEACDGAELGGASCESLGFLGGVLACNEKCSELDTSGCSPLPSVNGCCTVGTSDSCLDDTVKTCVCDAVAGCCDSEWGEVCVDMAMKVCGVTCP